MVWYDFFGKGKKLFESGIGLVAPKNFYGDEDSEPQNISLQQMYDNAYLNFPLVNKAIDTTTEQVVQEFYFEGPNKKTILDFADVHNLGIFFYNINKLLLKNGNAWVEVPKKNGEILELKILDPKTFTVVRERTGKILAHVQNVNNFFVVWSDLSTEKLEEIKIKFDVRKPLGDIVHFKWNVIGNEKYGTSLIHSLLSLLDTKADIEEDLKVIIRRYAAPIIHAKVGSENSPPTKEQIVQVKNSLTDIYSDTEYATSYLVELVVLGFEGKGMDVSSIIQHVDTNIMAGLQVPSVLLEGGSATDRDSDVKLRSFNRHVKAIQRHIKVQFEDKIIVGQKLGTIKDKLVWGSAEEREKEVEFDLIRGLVKDGVITAQKANSLLPPKFHERLPPKPVFEEMPIPDTSLKGSDKIKDNPTNPTKSSKLMDSPGSRSVDKNFFQKPVVTA